MWLDPNNDKYPGDLALLNKRKHQWSKAGEKGTKYKYGSFAVLAAGFAAIVFVASKTPDGASQLPIHLTIWVVALLTYLVAHRGRVLSEAPFNGYHSARFEVSDDTVFYVYEYFASKARRPSTYSPEALRRKKKWMSSTLLCRLINTNSMTCLLHIKGKSSRLTGN